MSKLDDWRRLAEKAYDHAKLLDRDELLALLDVIEAYKRWSATVQELEPDELTEALARLEREGR
jgi:hypothetical protein